MADRSNALKARVAKGFKDTTASDLRQRTAMIDTIRRVYESYGFDPLETPAVEYVDVLGKFLPEQDQPDGGIFALRDNDEQWISLRYDLTAPLSRFVAERWATLSLPFRRYQVGPVYRNEKPGPGRYREFYQFDVDTIGAGSMAADAENCAIMAETLEALGIARGDYAVKVNNRKVLDGVLESIGITPGGDLAASLPVLRAVDKFDKVGLEGVRLLLTKGRMDESGDFTKGAGLSDDQAAKVLAYMDITAETRAAVCAGLRDVVGRSEIGAEGIAELEEIGALLDRLGIDETQCVFDPSVVRGLAYYTGPVLEVGITFEIADENGQPRQFGSVAGGGRYDGLVERFVGKRVPATGVSIGVDRLLAALAAAGRLKDDGETGPVLVTVMDPSRLADYAAIAQELRAAGIRTELYTGENKFKAQMKYADRRQAPVAVIAGGDEFDAGTVSLKDLEAGRAQAGDIASHEEWKDKSRAQTVVPRTEIVAQVRTILERRRAP
ncbi:MAG: histidine--tRNA ligase [Alphaproteobacteria bacterium]